MREAMKPNQPNRDPLLAAFHAAETMTDAAARARLRELCGRPLDQGEMDLLDFLAKRLNVTIRFKQVHYNFATERWADGSGQGAAGCWKVGS